MESFDEYYEKEQESLLQHELKKVSFSFSKEQIDAIMNEYIQQKQEDEKKEYRTIEDAEELSGKVYDPLKVINEIQKFYALSDRDDITEVSKIVHGINENYNSNSDLPYEVVQVIGEIKEHYRYLLALELQKKNSDDVQKEIAELPEQSDVEDLATMEIQKSRRDYVQSKLPIIREIIGKLSISGNKEFESKRIEILKTQNKFYHLPNISQEDIDELDNFIEYLRSIDVKKDFVVEEVQDNSLDQEQIEKYQEEIRKYDERIESLLESIKPYMGIDKVNREISKVITKNNEVNALIENGKLSDYEDIVKIKKDIVDYLERANDFILTNASKEENKASEEKVTEDFWDEFDNNETLTRPERKFNEDGTYTFEYMSYLAASSGPEAQTVYRQLEDYNERIRSKKELTDMMKDAEHVEQTVDQNVDNKVAQKEYGFVAFYVLAFSIVAFSIALVIVSTFMK
jgi:hypothetical protein